MERFLNVIAVLSLISIGVVLASVRRAHIRVEYSVAWLVAGVAMFLLSRFDGFLAHLAIWLGLADRPVTLLFITAFVFLIVFYRFSLRVSDLKDANIALAQRVAILEYQLRTNHENQQADKAG